MDRALSAATSQSPAEDEASSSLYLPPFRVDMTVRHGIVAPVSRRRLAVSMRAALEAAGAPGPASIGLILSGDAELAELNATHMGQAGPTDVLSFPLLPPEAFPLHEHGKPVDRDHGVAVALQRSFALPPGRRVHLGDVVVSVERAIAQASEGRGGQTGDVRWTPAREMLLLAIHGTLHVCGWDHAEPIEAAAMRALENRVLESLPVDHAPAEI